MKKREERKAKEKERRRTRRRRNYKATAAVLEARACIKRHGKLSPAASSITRTLAADSRVLISVTSKARSEREKERGASEQRVAHKVEILIIQSSKNRKQVHEKRKPGCRRGKYIQ